MLAIYARTIFNCFIIARWLVPGTQVWELEGQLMRAEVYLSIATMKCNRGRDGYIKELSFYVNTQLIRIPNCQNRHFFPKRSFQLLTLFKNSNTTFSHAGKPKLDQGVYLYSKLLSLWKLQDLCYSTCLHGHCAIIPGKRTCFHHSSAMTIVERDFTQRCRELFLESFLDSSSDPCTG